MELEQQKASKNWKVVGLIVLPIRFVQGWIFWAGGSRRFIYDPQKLDPHSSTWLAHKLQGAMPGALLGVGNVISFMLQHFWLLYITLVVFSLLELLSGLCLILGVFTRLCAFITAFISVALMLSFGWEGGTCLDEWTMAVSTFAMALVLMLSGGPTYSLDQWLSYRFKLKPKLSWLMSCPLKLAVLKRWAFALLIIAILFSTVTYNYFRGAIFSPYHPGPVSPTSFQLTLSQGQLYSNGAINFHLYMSGGTTSVSAYIIRIELVNMHGQIQEEWSAKELSSIPKQNIVNQYAYNKITTGPYGLVAPVSARAIILLKPNAKNSFVPGNYVLNVYLVNGKKWSLGMAAAAS